MVFPIRQPWDACGLGWYAPSEPGNAVRNPGSSKGSGNEPCRCAKPTAINGMRGFFPTSAACVKCPPPQDRSPSLDLRFRVKRLAGQPAPRRRAQTLKSPPNRAFYRFSLRALLSRSRRRRRGSGPRSLLRRLHRYGNEAGGHHLRAYVDRGKFGRGRVGARVRMVSAVHRVLDGAVPHRHGSQRGGRAPVAQD